MSQRLNSCGSSSLYMKPKKHLRRNVRVFFYVEIKFTL
nr:MAG TPA: hypothetical protein [Caudoviricetes sp.]DAZ71568.1 MAG TPA: hypothetical protein [Caudoviricetes sp.]